MTISNIFWAQKQRLVLKTLWGNRKVLFFMMGEHIFEKNISMLIKDGFGGKGVFILGVGPWDGDGCSDRLSSDENILFSDIYGFYLQWCSFHE